MRRRVARGPRARGVSPSAVGGWTGPILVALLLAGCAGGPIYPVASPATATAYRAPYEAVWNATVQSLGVVRPAILDRAQGHIVTGRFSHTLPVQAAGGPGGGSITTQVLSVSMDIRVLPTPDGATAVHVRTTIHDALQYGIWPVAGGPNSPEGDLYARIASRLSRP